MKEKKLKINKGFEDKTLIVKSRTENLSVIRDFVYKEAEAAGFNKEALDNIILAVDEACTNIIKHAYKLFPEGEIKIEVTLIEKTFTIKITDYGMSFKPDVVATPDIKKYYQQHRVGGLGLYLIKTLMDDVVYNSIPGKYNKVELIKYLQ